MIGFTTNLKAQVRRLERDLADRKSMGVKLFTANLRLARENAELRAKLAVFTAPRQRGDRGRFLSTKEQAA